MKDIHMRARKNSEPVRIKKQRSISPLAIKRAIRVYRQWESDHEYWFGSAANPIAVQQLARAMLSIQEDCVDSLGAKASYKGHKRDRLLRYLHRASLLAPADFVQLTMSRSKSVEEMQFSEQGARLALGDSAGETPPFPSRP